MQCNAMQWSWGLFNPNPVKPKIKAQKTTGTYCIIQNYHIKIIHALTSAASVCDTVMGIDCIFFHDETSWRQRYYCLLTITKHTEYFQVYDMIHEQ